MRQEIDIIAYDDMMMTAGAGMRLRSAKDWELRPGKREEHMVQRKVMPQSEEESGPEQRAYEEHVWQRKVKLQSEEESGPEQRAYEEHVWRRKVKLQSEEESGPEQRAYEEHVVQRKVRLQSEEESGPSQRRYEEHMGQRRIRLQSEEENGLEQRAYEEHVWQRKVMPQSARDSVMGQRNLEESSAGGKRAGKISTGERERMEQYRIQERPQAPVSRRAGMRKKRRLQRRIRRMKRMLCMAGVCVILLIVFSGVKNLLGNLSLPGDAGWWQTDGQRDNADDGAVDAALVVPKLYTDTQVAEKLLDLSASSQDYKLIYENMESYPEEMLVALCNNEEMLEFVRDYPQRSENAQGGFTAEEQEAAMPLLMQWDKRWGYVPYGSSCVGMSGCAPTCLSMVVLALTANDTATPDALAAYAWQEGYYTEGTGTSWSFLTQGAAHWGVNGQEIGLDETKIAAELEAGHPIICSMRPGDFTTAGHFIVLTGIEDGKIRVHDPNSRARSGRLWAYETLKGQIKNLWAYQ